MGILNKIIKINITIRVDNGAILWYTITVAGFVSRLSVLREIPGGRLRYKEPLRRSIVSNP